MSTTPPKPSALSHQVGREMSWQGRGVLQVGNWQLTDPSTYACNGARSQIEASCIDLKLPANKQANRARTEPLGYWPQYGEMSPAQRACYLEWLAGGRQDASIDIGYVFVYFYGLERRLLVDGKDAQWVLAEVVRLMNLFSNSRSFVGYSQRLLAYSIASSGIENLKEAEFGKDTKRLDQDILAVVLAALESQNRPLPPSLAFQIARMDGRSKQSVVIKRTPDEFFQYFELHYHRLFGEGMQLKASKRKERIGYHPASPSLSPYQSSYFGTQAYTFKDIVIPSVLALNSQFKPLVEIWNQGIEALKSYSKELGREQVDDRAAFEALPAELRKDSEHPDLEKWNAFLETQEADEKGIYLVMISQLAGLQEYSSKKKLTLKESKDLVQTAHVLGFCLEPDTRQTGATYAWDSLVGLYRNPSDHEAATGAAYAAASQILELGVVIAAADGQIEEVELEHISRFIEGSFLLNAADSLRLDAYSKTLQAAPSSITQVANRLKKTVEPKQLATIAKFGIGVAAANGEIDPGEIKALTRIFEKLEIPVEELDVLIAEASEKDNQLVVVRQSAQKQQQGEKIPARINRAETLRLDPEKIREIMHETQKISAILQEHLSDDRDNESALAPEPGASHASVEIPAVFAGLDAMYHQCLNKLLEHDQWASHEFEQLAREEKLMPAGLIDAINEWSDDHYGDYLLEEGDPITVNQYLLNNKS
ncbi:MAG: TerB N-terminal domain-containing protein [bacterium]|nr:TerB N-terminal domain-containing protein [bacterium]